MEKETIELIRKMIEDGNLTQEVAEKYCPEIKESDGEMIRKSLIDYLKERKSCESYGQYVVRYDRWIAWLKKQCEQKHIDIVEPKFKVGDILENKKSEDIVTIEKVSIEEQRYFFKHQKNGTKEFHGNFEFKDQIEWKLITEEKILVNELVVMCENLKTDQSNKFTLDTINKVSSFLQDLRDGYINLELTKEDEAKLAAALSYINISSYVSVYTKEAVSNWLKSKFNII